MLKEKEKKSLPINEIEKDVERLNLITNRFSKVGSKPELKPLNITSSIQETLSYLIKRSSKQILFEIDIPKKNIIIPFNPQLLSWTLENLIKNGIDSMKGKGKLRVQLNEKRRHVEILISDTGSGIKKELLSKIFKPGFTTKTRGWGLGLSLAKRIIEDFHLGKICLLYTSPSPRDLSTSRMPSSA